MLPGYLSFQEIYPLFHKVGLFQYERTEQKAPTETCSTPISGLKKYCIILPSERRKRQICVSA